jgi:hypothetical protein
MSHSSVLTGRRKDVWIEIRLLHCTRAAVRKRTWSRANHRAAVSQTPLTVRCRSRCRAPGLVKDITTSGGRSHNVLQMLQALGMLVKWARYGEDATRRTPVHPPPHPPPGLCEQAFTAHQLQNTVMPIMPFDVSTTSPPEACASELSHQLSSSHKCNSELSCSSRQYHSSASAPVQPGPDQARAPHISFPPFPEPCSWVPLRLSPSHPQRGSFSHSPDLIPSPFSWHWICGSQCPKFPNAGGRQVRQRTNPFLHFSHDCWSTTSSTLSALPTAFSCCLFLQPPRCRGLPYLDAQEAHQLVFLLNDNDPTRGLEGPAPSTA